MQFNLVKGLHIISRMHAFNEMYFVAQTLGNSLSFLVKYDILDEQLSRLFLSFVLLKSGLDQLKVQELEDTNQQLEVLIIKLCKYIQ